MRRQAELDPAGSGDSVARLIDVWPAARTHREDRGRIDMLRLLAQDGDAMLALRFLREAVLDRYDGTENEALPAVLAVVGLAPAALFLADLAGARFESRPGDVLRLLLLAGELDGFDWRDALADSVLAALVALPRALRPGPQPVGQAWPAKWTRRRRSSPNLPKSWIRNAPCRAY